MTSPASGLRGARFFSPVNAGPEPAGNGRPYYPLGRNGNLQYAPEAGGTARATRAEIAWSGVHRTLAGKWTGFKSCFIVPSERAQTQHDCSVETNPNLCDYGIGDLLGSLTVKVDSRMRRLAQPHDQSRIVQALLRSIRLSKGKSDASQAREACLRTLVKKLSDADLIALYSGVLNHRHARASVLRQVPNVLFYQASEELDRIALAVNRRFVQQVVREPFGQLAMQLAAEPMDEQALRGTLVRLARGLGQFEVSRTGRSMWSRDASLDIYIQLLPPELHRMLSDLVRRTTPLEKKQVPARKDSYACRMLDSIRMGLQRSEPRPSALVGSHGLLDGGLSGGGGCQDMQAKPSLDLKRKDLAACAFGIVGNLRFTAAEGVTVRASRVCVFLSETGHSLADRWAWLLSCLTRTSPEARARRAELAEVRVNSHRIGNLLGSLTAEVDRTTPIVNARDHARIAQALKELSVPARGGLYALKGARYCLDTYLSELKEFDLVALRHGMLSDEMACQDVLNNISIRRDDPLREQAARVLDEIAEAVNQRLARHSVHEPMRRLVKLLTDHCVDWGKLRAQLMMLPNDTILLERYFQTLSGNELEELLSISRSGSMREAGRVFAQAADGSPRQVLATLDSVQTLLMQEIHKRAARQNKRAATAFSR